MPLTLHLHRCTQTEWKTATEGTHISSLHPSHRLPPALASGVTLVLSLLWTVSTARLQPTGSTFGQLWLGVRAPWAQCPQLRLFHPSGSSAVPAAPELAWAVTPQTPPALPGCGQHLRGQQGPHTELQMPLY